jgi:hypothetical protein
MRRSRFSSCQSKCSAGESDDCRLNLTCPASDKHFIGHIKIAFLLPTVSPAKFAD